MNIAIEELNMKINEQDYMIQSKSNEIDLNEKTIMDLNNKMKSLEEINAYLKDKDQQMEYIFQTKENSIENLRKMLANVSSEMDEIEEENMNSKKIIHNL